jgi:hypothetical protein
MLIADAPDHFREYNLDWKRGKYNK